MMTKKTGGRLKKLFFPLASMAAGTVAAMIIAEMVLRIMGLGYGYAPLEPDPILHHVHPRDYLYTAYTPTGEYGGFEVYYDHNRLVSDPDLRGPGEERADASCLIALMGDSFTEAGQVPYSRSFAGMLSENSRCSIKNFGTSSYSPILYLLQWQYKVKHLHPALVVLQLYSNDIADDENYAGMAEFDANGDVTAVPGPARGWLRKQLRRSYLMRFIRQAQMKLRWMTAHRGEKHNVVEGLVEEDPALTPLTSSFMLKLADEVEATGARFVMFVVPSRYRLLHPQSAGNGPCFSDRWKSWADKHAVNFIDMVRSFEKAHAEGMQMFFRQDIHFTEQGHMMVTRGLIRAFPDFFNSEFLIKSPSKGTAPDSQGFGPGCRE